MSNNIENEDKIKINSATSDDLWISCDSTSRPGLKFYVNKSTGIKVWNITESEIAFAESVSVGSQEPKRRPIMNQPPDSTIYNKQIINNQFSNQLPNLVVNSAPINVWNRYPNMPQNQVQAQQQYMLVPTVQAFPQACPQWVTLPANLHNTSLPISYDAQETLRTLQFSQNQPTQRNQRQFFNKWQRNKKGLKKATSHNHYSHNYRNLTENVSCSYSDLRQKCVRRKSFSESYDNNNGHEKHFKLCQKWEKSSIQVNLEPLKLLISLGSDSTQWYIVVDTDVILHNYNYLNDIAVADSDCHLVIPQYVLNELQTHVERSTNMKARRIIRFLTDQIATGLVMLGEKVPEEDTVNMAIMTCTKLAIDTDTNHVVLISNNPNTFKYKWKANNIHIFTMEEVKDILAKKPSRLRMAASPTVLPHISVPNGTTHLEDDTLGDCPEYSQSSPKSMFQRELTNTDVGSRGLLDNYFVNDFNIPQKECTDTDIGALNLPREQSMEHIEATETMMNNNEFTDTDAGASNLSTASSAEHLKTVSNQVLPKRRFKLRRTNRVLADVKGGEIPRNSSRVESITTNKSPSHQDIKQQKECANTDIGNPSFSRVHSMDHFKTPSHQNIMQQGEYANTDIGNPSLPRVHSMYHFETPKTALKNNEPADTHIGPRCLSRAQPEELFKTPELVSSDNKFFSGGDNSRSALENPMTDHNRSPPRRGGYTFSMTRKSVDQSPTKSVDSLCSSSATSGHVSLDTIRMKHIISMKRLASTDILRRKQAQSVSTDTSKASIKSQSSYDSQTSVSKKKVAENIIVEETSTSGVISNSESSQSEKAKPIKREIKKVALRNVFMYKVVCQSMEDVLRTRCDEWVFRFVQIMEEVLRVKLQEKLPWDNKMYPAPRDLQEAARSILKKFSENFNVVDAANKLSFMLYKTSDDDGKIALNIQPSDYMDMYSYGVFLVETFQDMSADCTEKHCNKETSIKSKGNEAESCSCYEVTAASDALKKLLYDIHNSNIETFVDHPHDFSSENLHSDSDQYDYEPAEKVHDPEAAEFSYEQQDEIQCNNVATSPVPSTYNLRSQKRKSLKSEDEEVSPKVAKYDKSSKTNFFAGLQLQQSTASHSSDMNVNLVKQKTNKDQMNQSEQQTSNEPPKQNLNDLKIHFSNDDLTTQSKVVRNFTVNADFERKVKAKQNEAEYEEIPENVDRTVTDKIPAANENNKNKDEIDVESNRNFAGFMGSLWRRVRAAFTTAKMLCDEYNKLKDKKEWKVSKKEILEQLELTYTYYGTINHVLDSIGKQNLQDKDKTIQNMLNIAKMENYVPDEKLLHKFANEYRWTINKCKDKAEELHNCIRKILIMER